MKPRILLILILVVLFAIASTVAASSTSFNPPGQETQSTPDPSIASELELQQAYAEWSQSKHADTYDEGLGANTNCARCKAPMNWDPHNTVQDAALDCYSCKRVPGEARPELAGSEIVEVVDWLNIGCAVCHQPIGDSFSVQISFWNQEIQTYEPVEHVNELCAKCHEGLHGFEVIHEQEISPAHNNWECTKCHGSHGKPASCTTCHDPTTGTGAKEHTRHPSVNCTACHDAGKLAIYKDLNPSSKFFGQTIPNRYAHTITSWPSHNLSKEVSCIRCHHPGGTEQPVIAQEVSCEACHADGAVLFWCEFFPRDGDQAIKRCCPTGCPRKRGEMCL